MQSTEEERARCLVASKSDFHFRLNRIQWQTKVANKGKCLVMCHTCGATRPTLPVTVCDLCGGSGQVKFNKTRNMIALDPKLVRPMTRAEEEALFTRYHETSDPHEKKRLKDRAVLSVYKIAVREAGKVSGHVPIEDRVQAGVVGLMKAFDKFDHRRGNRFNTYAPWWCRLAIWELIGAERTILSKSGYRDGRDPEELRAIDVVYVDSLESSDKHGLLDSAELPADIAAELGERREALYGALLSAKLTDDERRVIELRWLSGGERTLKAVSGELGGYSREWIRQLEKSAMAKLRKLLKELEE